MEVLLARAGGRSVSCAALDALGRPGRAPYALLYDGLAVVEMARASGIARLGGAALDPLGATSYGTGQLIAAALRRLRDPHTSGECALHAPPGRRLTW
jgi:glycerate kinase